MWHSESSPDLNSASVATFLPSNPFLVVFVLLVLYLVIAFFSSVLCHAVFSGMGDYSSFPSVICKICFSFVDHGSVAFLYFLVMYVVMLAVVVDLARGC